MQQEDDPCASPMPIEQATATPQPTSQVTTAMRQLPHRSQSCIFSSSLPNAPRLHAPDLRLTHSLEAPAPLLECYRSSQHPDLLSINHRTLVRLMHDRNRPFVIIDCRYPYEFAGGHIRSAKNLFTEDKIDEFFLKHPSANGSQVIIIFHCEFSANRGPTMMRYLREQDRQRSTYPNLIYPHLFLLDGGYRSFYQNNTDSQDMYDGGMNQYVQMDDNRFRTELHQYHAICQTRRREKKLQRCMSSRAISFDRVNADQPQDPCASPQ